MIVRWMAIIGMTVATLASETRADDVARFLEEHKLLELLAVHLEDSLDDLSSSDREDAVARLADLYAELLETIEDPGHRAAIEERSRRLLAEAPPRGVNRLRLALVRGAYRAAERIAEQHRLRLADPDDLISARETLAEIVPELQSLRSDIRDRIESLERELGRTSGTGAVVVSDELEAVRELRAQCTFLAAWALYYHAYLNDRGESARAAQDLFSELLEVGIRGRPEDVSIDRRVFEPFARSILGAGLCRSQAGATASAIRWIGLLEHPTTIQSLREQAPIWKIVVCLEGGEYVQVREQMTALDNAGREIPSAWLRLIGIGAMEAAERSRLAAELARIVMTRLATLGELDQIIDLAGRYGMDSLGESGFAFQYVDGVLAYHDARQEHGGEYPTIEDSLVRQYASAVSSLRAALDEADAIDYPSAAADARRLIAWSLYFRGDFLEARDAFLSAEAQAGPEDGPTLLWMAIVSIDKVTRAGNRNGGAGTLQDEADALIDRFLTRYPHSEHAPRLLYRKALAESEDAYATAQRLLEIPENSEIYPSAQRKAADLLYDLFRSASGTRRVQYANEFLAVAVPAFRPMLQPDALVGETWDRYIARGRRILEVALAHGVGRTSAAQLVLETFERLDDQGDASVNAIREEITYRRLQERLVGDHVQRAVSIAEELWSDPPSVWGRKAARAIFTYAYDRWNRANDIRTRDEWASMVISHGERVLSEYDTDPVALERPGVLSYFTAVADARMEVGERRGDDEMLREALALYERLLDARPDAVRFLRSAAVLSQRFGENQVALSCWRRILAGTTEQSDAWLEAKYNLILVLSRTDPPRALEVMEQHERLYPDYGPEPWGTRLRGLAVRIRQPEDPTSQEDGDG